MSSAVRNIPDEQIKKQPRPIIIDRDLRSPPGCRLFAAGRSPIVLFAGASNWRTFNQELSERAKALSSAGVCLQTLEPGMSGLPCRRARMVKVKMRSVTHCFSPDHFNMESMLECLKATFDIQTVLIEPGLRMIPRLLCPPSTKDQPKIGKLVDIVYITTGSTVVGPAGRMPDWSSVQSDQQPGAPFMEFVESMVVGQDTVSALRVVKVS